MRVKAYNMREGAKRYPLSYYRLCFSAYSITHDKISPFQKATILLPYNF